MVERCSRFAERRDKAVELFAKKGFMQVGMRELAACLGLSAGTLYHYYSSKQEMLFEVIEELYEQRLRLVAQVGDRPKNRHDRINALIIAHLKLHDDMPWHSCLAERDISCLTVEQQCKIKKLRERYEQSLNTVLGATSEASESAYLTIAVLVANLLNSAPAWLIDSTLEKQTRKELLQALLTTAVGKLLTYCASADGEM
ncbi:TetR/AcrR family transcriptional regulator [Pseudomonas poae]|uniref:TetR/AcrR family transcriptional regulator n=1 Tax=Pseudomonas poae TaxID=200451 RepID=UPI00147571DC|nr:TetR/AcrR family transcriptional regulator [Pseudomonas poae]NMZ51896.1 helix-turn-helix transcriptional regulator [Pseudomonas poae]